MESNENFLLDYCCLRMPSQPIDTFVDFNEQIKNINLDSHEEIVKVLKHIFANKYYKEAIYIASKELYRTFIEVELHNFDNKDYAKKFLITFFKYLSRMSTRSTPYGLFSGTSSISLNNEPSDIQFTDDKNRLICRLNIHKLTNMIRNINPLDVELIDKIKFYTNNTLYIIENKGYFIEQFDNGRYIASNLTSVRISEYLEKMIECGKKGATVNELVNEISIPNISTQQKQDYVKKIIQSQILVSELLPSVSTENFIEDLISIIDAKEINITQISELKEIYNVIKNLSHIDDIPNFRNYIEENPQNGIISKDFYKLDLFYNLKTKNLNREIINEINSTSYELLHMFSPKTSPYLTNFITLFYSKYEEKEVPLNHVLDSNYGIGYEKVITGNAEFTPLLEGVPIMSDPNYELKIPYGDFEILREKIFINHCKTGGKIINITAELENHLSSKVRLSEKSHSPSSYIFGRILSDSLESLDKGDYKFFPIQCHAPFAGRLLTRFAHGDKELEKQVKEIAKLEQKNNPNVIFAEVLTIPDDDYANIALYPTIREYEIPFLSNSKLDKEHQINTNDLLVSIRNRRVVLRSKKLNKEIIPCLSNTYNTTLAQPLYKFLADVGSQNTRLGYFWDWGTYQNESFLPRIEYKKVIISRARWYIKKEKIDYKDNFSIEKGIRDIIKKYNLPSNIVLSSGDNELLLDLNNKVCQYILLKEINHQNVILFESIQDVKNCFIKDNGKSYASEIVIPTINSKAIYKSVNATMEKTKIKRVFSPGSEWLYVKIYSGAKNIEDILTEVVSDFATDLIKQRIIDKWFFIKYNDPDYHIRVRFHCSESERENHEWYHILENLQKKVHNLIKEEHVVKIIADTYVREIERYGINTMELSERIFFHDSVAVSSFINLIAGDEGEVLRWKFALVNVNKLFNDFGYSTQDKLRLISTLSENFLNEFSYNNSENYTTLSRILSSKYRENRKLIHDIIFKEENSQYLEAFMCFNKRSTSIMLEVSRHPELSQTTKDHLLVSYIHMTLNRHFMINQRRQELVIYYFLKKEYESAIAQSKNNVII